jgi:hypothetical protein
MRYYVEVEGNDGARARHDVRARPLCVGRAPSNDLVLRDDSISGHHAMLWADAGGLWVEDLKSRSGTKVNGDALAGVSALRPGDTLMMGERSNLRVCAHSDEGDTNERTWLVEDIQVGMQTPVWTDRFTIGPQKNADLVVPDAPDDVTLLVHDHSEVWLGRDGDMRKIGPDEVFEVGTRCFCLRLPKQEDGTGSPIGTTSYAYGLRARVAGPTGPEATLRDLRNGTSCVVRADTRAVLMYLLARKLRDDHDCGMSPADSGWCAEAGLAVGVWGHGASVGHSGNLNVLLFRVRREFAAAGFDPWFIETRRRHVRARVESVDVD